MLIEEYSARRYSKHSVLLGFFSGSLVPGSPIFSTTLDFSYFYLFSKIQRFLTIVNHLGRPVLLGYTVSLGFMKRFLTVYDVY